MQYMSENGDNIIPFRKRRQQEGVSGPRMHQQEHGSAHVQRNAPPVQASVRIAKLKLPEGDIAFSQQLAALKFRAPGEFLASLTNLSAAARKAALLRETDLLAQTVANDHRVFVLAARSNADLDGFYRQCHQLKTSLDSLAADLGRASIFNVGGITVEFVPGLTSEWHKGRDGEELRLSESFAHQDVVALLRPRLQPATAYEHEIFDVSYRNG